MDDHTQTLVDTVGLLDSDGNDYVHCLKLFDLVSGRPLKRLVLMYNTLDFATKSWFKLFLDVFGEGAIAFIRNKVDSPSEQSNARDKAQLENMLNIKDTKHWQLPLFLSAFQESQTSYDNALTALFRQAAF